MPKPVVDEATNPMPTITVVDEATNPRPHQPFPPINTKETSQRTSKANTTEAALKNSQPAPRTRSPIAHAEFRDTLSPSAALVSSHTPSVRSATNGDHLKSLTE